MNGFTFYNNYYELIKYLDDKDRLEMYDAVFKYMFDNEEPSFEGIKKGLWINIKMPLDTSKNKGKSGSISKQNQTKIKTKSNKNQKEIKSKTNNNISIFLFLFSNLYISNLNNKENIYNLLKEYLELRKKEKYILSETVVKRLINKLNEYGTTDEDKEEIIMKAINGKWKDFYPLKKIENKPEWFGKNIKEEKATKEEIKEMKNLLKEFK